MTNYLTPENMKIYMEHLKTVDAEVEKSISESVDCDKCTEWENEIWVCWRCRNNDN
jgi:hypothetical protein